MQIMSGRVGQDTVTDQVAGSVADAAFPVAVCVIGFGPDPGDMRFEEQRPAQYARSDILLQRQHGVRKRPLKTDTQLPAGLFGDLFQEKGITVSATRVEDTAVLFRLLSFDREPCLMKGVKETLEELRRQGVHLYMLSNAQSCFTIPELRRLGLLDGFFDGIFLSSDFGSKKPFPAFFHAALAQAGLSCSEVLMVGNDPDADIRGADAVGMKSRYIHSWQSPPRGFILPESCREIQSLEELLKDS